MKLAEGAGAGAATNRTTPLALQRVICKVPLVAIMWVTHCAAALKLKFDRVAPAGGVLPSSGRKPAGAVPSTAYVVVARSPRLPMAALHGCHRLLTRGCWLALGVSVE